MTITKLASEFGLRPSTLRFYEKEGLLAPAGRTGGRRVYDDSAFRRLALIIDAQDSGLTLAEIRGLIDRGELGEAPKTLWKDMAARKLAELHRQIQMLTSQKAELTAKLGCKCSTLEVCERLISRKRIRFLSTETSASQAETSAG
jgi:DNA-binding transcriptional MerR regulator